LGGKSPQIITEHANLEKTVQVSSIGLFINSGQTCIAGSRVYVHAKLYDQYV
jgi:acyl-CoA reductase-like NAD-dependent aldehyde dehydrogenase